ncbi:uncharacterized protein L969DRAFT_17526 [Mixia osmundae IAM 14324]|uniref:DUF962 domain protein n=1 Tax=Mixia osmundae (strain CBS 9802 / IAM 14324 / JCM 22182 / KY 12970) TaxID=764103 RepID=G7DVV7_MIXOS|nr:uncharacterized protein L969DRAFT_17526 [Mixia osmundae IAM 14324]KEI39604.1 hypothetical protein L969DRAFT_17526 [Mixia osmundae IAM 14324]GAA94717.1 hypothetical protein E5Q_01370 [Mixia osmundae IAM 14324]
MSAVEHPEKASKLNLVDQFEFYGQYHTNRVNVAIHIICVPLIFWTTLILSQSWSPTLASFSLEIRSFRQQVDVTIPLLIATSYASYFVLLDWFAGALYAPVLLAMGVSSKVIYDTVDDPLKKAGIVFVGSWIAQFVGHGKFEGRAPALFDSLFQSLVLAVFFVFMEVLFALGYRRELHKTLKNRIGKAVTAYRRDAKAKGKGDPKSVKQQPLFRA